MMKYDYRVLLRYKHTGSISENSVELSKEFVLGNNAVAQIHKIEIIPPTNGGQIENVFIRLVIDGNEYPNIFLHSLARNVILGDHLSTDPMKNTCPKVGDSIALKIIGGPGGVTGDFEVRVWGDYFVGDDTLTNFFGATVFNNMTTPREEGADLFRNIYVSVHNPTPITTASFTSLPGGGANANKPNVMPMYIYNFNNVATTVNEEFDFSKTNVWSVQFPMYWNLKGDSAIILDRIGANVKSNGNIVGIKVGTIEYPESNYYVVPPYNEIPLNQGLSVLESLNVINRAVIIENSIGTVFMKDNGHSIPVQDALIGIKGRIINFPVVR